MRRILSVVVLVCAFALTASAGAIPAGWTCQGTCGSLGANGDVTLGPSGSPYEYISTNGSSVTGLGLKLASETNGTLLSTATFSAAAGDPLHFYFNFVTSDGSGFADYAWVDLVNASTLASTLLFTARTTPSGNTVPGFSMPPIAAGVTLSPSTVTVTPGATTWSPLGDSSGGCYHGPGQGCGNTGWVGSSFTIGTAGNYFLDFGVVNWSDTAYDTGLAIDNVTVAGTPIPGDGGSPVPEPSSIALVATGLLGLAGSVRRRLAR